VLKERDVTIQMASAGPAAEAPKPRFVKLPAPTPWPIVLAFGVTLVFSGMLTSISVTLLGTILVLAACAGWFRDVLPQEKQVEVPIVEEHLPITTQRPEVARLEIAPNLHRALLPLETYPISAGVKGGLAGSVAMAVLACLYGIVKQGSIWYPINLLAATAYFQSAKLDSAFLKAFHLDGFLFAVVLHLVTSLLVGLLYGAMLPMFPRRPILLGGIIAPVMWTGLLYSILGLINPLLEQRIDWVWFVASQFAFGIVAGLVVVRQDRVRTRQFLPFSIRAGFETPAVTDLRRKDDRP
jgi:hypothetical protein